MTQSKGFTILSMWALTSVTFDKNAKKFVRVLAAIAATGLALDYLQRERQASKSSPKTHPLLKANEFIFERVETIEI